MRVIYLRFLMNICDVDYRHHLHQCSHKRRDPLIRFAVDFENLAFFQNISLENQEIFSGNWLRNVEESSTLLSMCTKFYR